MPPLHASHRPARWLLLGGLLGLVWLLTPNPVPLYDGIGFPDQPYRFVGRTPAPTAAQVRLPVSGGVNTGGLFANSGELGPQVSVYAPPRAFAVAASTQVVVAASPVAMAPPPPPGTVDSNVYDLTFTSPGGPVTLVKDAQSPAITMRSASQATAGVLFEFRPAAGGRWQELQTRQVGRDTYNAAAPGAGQYVLVKPAQAAARSGGRGLYVVIGAAVLLVLLTLVGVRVLSQRQQS